MKSSLLHPSFKNTRSNLLFKILISIPLVLVLLLTAEAINRASYGESCNMTTFCRSKEFISCQDGICTCVKPDAMIYETEKKICVTLAGERCSYTLVSSQDNSNSNEEKIISYRQDLSCVKNSTCNREGACVCDTRFFQASNGTCAFKKNFGNTCSAGQCREDLLLQCNVFKGTCACQNGTTYDEYFKRCVGRAGERCAEGRFCAKNAECDLKEHIGDENDYERHNFNYYNNRGREPNPNFRHCQCKPDFMKWLDKTCLGPHGTTCDSSSDCFPGLTCRNQLCSCQYPTHQEYEVAMEQCITKIGGPCVLSNASNDIIPLLQHLSWTPCLPHASCVAKEKDIPKCTCNPGFIENSERRCDLAFGTPCPNEVQIKCDREAGLVCEDSLCTCPDKLHTYDPVLQKCRGLVGSTCSTKEDNGFCTEGSYCVPLRVSKNGVGICNCLKGYSIVPENLTCEGLKDVDTTFDHGAESEDDGLIV